MKKWKIISLILIILLIAPWIAWVGGRPIRHSLSGDSNVSLVRWHLGKEGIEKYGALADICFDIPERYSVQIDRQEDFAIYQILDPAGKKFLSLYFGNHPDWPPRTRWVDWRGKAVRGDTSFDVVSYWSFSTVSKEVWICRSPRGWGVHCRYTHFSKQDAALADKVIESIQPPVRPGD